MSAETEWRGIIRRISSSGTGCRQRQKALLLMRRLGWRNEVLSAAGGRDCLRAVRASIIHPSVLSVFGANGRRCGFRHQDPAAPRALGGTRMPEVSPERLQGTISGQGLRPSDPMFRSAMLKARTNDLKGRHYRHRKSDAPSGRSGRRDQEE